MSFPNEPDREPRAPKWTLLSNHAHVLLCLARDPDLRLRHVADLVLLTERGVHRIVTDLEAAGVIERVREGRRNHYEIDPSVSLRHPVESDCTVGSLLKGLLSPAEAERMGLEKLSAATTGAR